MRKCSASVWAILLALSMILTPMSTVYADTDETVSSSVDQQETAEPETVSTEAGETKLKDGTYPVTSWSFVKKTGVSKRTFTMNDTLEVRDGIAYVTLSVDSVSYEYAVVNDTQYPTTVDGENATFEIPAVLGEEVDVSLYSSSMATLIAFVMKVEADVPAAEDTTPSEGESTTPSEGEDTTPSEGEDTTPPEVTWQDGYYIGTGTVTPENNYPREEYDVQVGVKIEDGKIVDISYVEEPTYDNGNLSYMIWAMNGHHTDTTEKEGGSYTYLTGTAQQILDAQSADDIDVVSGATWTSRAIKDSVQAALAKAEKGEKDTETPTVEPAKEIKTPDKEGVYTVDAAAYGYSLLDGADVLLTYKDGKMTVVFTTTMRPASYDYLYMGTEDEAYAAGKDAWSKAVAEIEYVDSNGKIKTGNQYEVPVESLDQEIGFIVHAKSSGNWFYRAIKLDSATLVAVDVPDQDTPNQDTPDQDTPNQDTPDQDTPNQDNTNQGNTNQGNTNQGNTNQDNANQNTQDQNTSNTNNSDTNTSNTNSSSSSQTVNTGDTTGTIYVWTILCMVSAGCAVLIFFRRKKNHI